MNINVEDIYLSKLNQFRSKIEVKASKCSGASGVFQNLLSDVENRMNLANSEVSTNYNSTIYTSATKTIAVSQSSDEIEAAVMNAAYNTGLDPNLIRAVIQTESSFRTNAVSSCGAQGLMQLMPGTAKELGVKDSFDAYQNVNGGATYLKKQIDRFGDVRLALAAYNTGPARIASLKITDADDESEYGKISSGVRGYVDKVMTYYDQFSRMYS